MRSSREPEIVTDRVYRVAGSDITDGSDCCVYLVDGGSSLALVDAGCGPSFGAIVANVAGLGFEPADIRSILLTHCHIDHVGGAAAFRREYGCELLAHAADAEPLEKGDGRLTAADLYGVRLEPLAIDRELTEDREELRVGGVLLNVVFTPGHSPGSVSAYADVGGTRVLFGQDIHGPFHPDFGSDIELWRGSMQTLLDLEADVLCEGHFGVIGPAGAVRGYINSYLDRY